MSTKIEWRFLRKIYGNYILFLRYCCCLQRFVFSIRTGNMKKQYRNLKFQIKLLHKQASVTKETVPDASSADLRQTWHQQVKSSQ